MIDKRELLARARELRLPLPTVEKDYVLGWVLFGLTHIRVLVFKGGTALAKVYFPEAWRLSEDLDFATAHETWDELPEQLPDALELAARRSGVQLLVKSQHRTPEYMQLKVQYSGPLGRNWLKVDLTTDPPITEVLSLPLSRSYSDYPNFRVRVESLEEIFAQKLRALVQRKKARDYYDAWRMTQLTIRRGDIARLFARKLRARGLAWQGLGAIFPPDLAEVLQGYWEKELGRLVYPVPAMRDVLDQLRSRLRWLGTGLG